MQPAQEGLGSKGVALFVITILAVSAAVAALAVLSGRPVQPRQTTTQGSSTPVSAFSQGLSSFSSYAALESFITANAKSAQNYDTYGGGGFVGGPVLAFGGVRTIAGGPVAGVGVTTTETMTAMATSASTVAAGAQASLAANSASTPAFTGTNVQVQGVDELDFVKTDGTHIFVASGSGSNVVVPLGGEIVRANGPGSAGGFVSIINAYPPSSAAVLSTLSFPGATVLGIETAQDRLLVVDQRNTNATYNGLILYDTTNLSAPKLLSNVTIAGNFVGARMTQGYLYAIVQQPSYQWATGNASGVLPYITSNGVTTALAPSSVYYTPNDMQIGDYTVITSVSMATGAQSTLSVLTGPSSTIYVSTSNIYVAYSDYREFADADGIPGDVFSGGAITSLAVQQQQNSTIFRAAYDNGTVAVQAVGSVPGNILNQFSMDEYNGYFRVATSRIATINGNATMSDDVYVLNLNMSQAAALQNIAPGENLYAVRFEGDVGYVVTFEQVDPLFTISFANPTQPVIESALKVNGYSDYLQQVFPGYLVGLGKDTVQSSNGNFAYYLGLKLSLFHVAANGSSSDVQDYYIGDRGTDSPALTDHLAFTFDSANNVTAIPVLLYKVSGSQTTEPGGIPPYGNPVWQGDYVLKVNASGFTLLGMVSQYPASMPYGDSPNPNLQIDRSIIIGNYLYTISASEVMATDLSTFSTLATIPLPGS